MTPDIFKISENTPGLTTANVLSKVTPPPTLKEDSKYTLLPILKVFLIIPGPDKFIELPNVTTEPTLKFSTFNPPKNVPYILPFTLKELSILVAPKISVVPEQEICDTDKILSTFKLFNEECPEILRDSVNVEFSVMKIVSEILILPLISNFSKGVSTPIPILSVIL